MTSKHFFTLALIGAGVAVGSLAGVGCGGGSSGTAGTGGTSSTTTKTTTKTTSGTTTQGTGGAGGSSGNHDPGSATAINIDDPVTMGTLVDTMTQDWYSFAGKAGDRLIIDVHASDIASNASFDPLAIVPAFGLYSSGVNAMKGTPLTFQVGEWPNFSQDALLFVQLPADGMYFLNLADCNGFFSMPYPANGCQNDPTKITGLDYELLVAHTSKLTNPELLAAATQDGTTAKSQPVKYVVPSGGTAGEYGEVVMGGDFPSASTTHVFSFTPPADLVTAAGARARAEFYVQPITTSAELQAGDLSDANVKIWATDSTGTKIISQADQSTHAINSMEYSPLQFSLPITAGQQYYLFVQNEQTAGTPAMDFYFIAHYLNPLIDIGEKEPPTMSGMNDTSATAEGLTGQGSAKDFFTVDGNIAMNATDIDWFSFSVPSNVTAFQIQCDAFRSGSGLGGFTAQLFGADATTSIAMMAETPTTDLLTMQANLPSGVTAGTKLFLKLSATSQDTTVTGSQYRCYVFFG